MSLYDSYLEEKEEKEKKSLYGEYVASKKPSSKVVEKPQVIEVEKKPSFGDRIKGKVKEGISKAKKAVSDVKEYYGYKPKESIKKSLEEIKIPKIEAPAVDREKVTNFLKSVVETSPPVVGAKIVKESFKDTKDFLSGVTGAWSAEGKRLGGQNFEPQPEAEFTPKNRYQELGVIGYDLMKFRVQTQAGGQSEAIQGGIQAFSGAIKASPLLSPKVAFVQDALGKFTSKQFAKFLNRIKPLNLTFDEAVKVTTGKGTPEQIARYQKVVEYSEQSGVPMKEIIAKSSKMKVKPNTKIYDFIKNSVNSIKKILNSSLTKEEQKLLTAGGKSQLQQAIIKPGKYTPQQVVDTVVGSLSQNTNEGSILLKSAIEAKETGQNIVIGKAGEVVTKPVEPPVVKKEVVKPKEAEVKPQAKPVAQGGLYDKTGELGKKFQHHSWYKGGMTKGEALDDMAKTGDFYLDKKPSKIQSSRLLDDTIYDDIIKYAGKEGGSYRVSPVEKKYFLERTEFHKKMKAKEMLRKANDPIEQAKKIKVERAGLEYNLRSDQRELSTARKKYPENIDFWSKKLKESKKKLAEFNKKIDDIYHGTGEGQARNIQKEGLKTGQAIGSKGDTAIYFSDTEKYAETYAKRKSSYPVMLRVKQTGDIIPDPNTGLKGDFKTTKQILPENIEIKTPNGDWVPIKDWDFSTKDVAQPPISDIKPSPLPSPIKRPVPPQARKGAKKPSRGVVKKGKEYKLTYPEVSKLPKTKLEELESKQGGFTQDFRERVKKGKLSPGDVERAFNIKVKPIDIKNLIRNLPELKENPILTYQKGKGLIFEGKTHKFSIKPEALGVKSEKLKSGDIINLEGFEYKGKIPVLKKQKGVPGGYGDPGGYADIKSTEQRLANIKAIEMPEMVRIAREVMGEAPTLKKFRKSLGMFYGKNSGIIKLDPEIFKNPEIAAKVMAHELGHMADYFEDRTLARGNLVGRVASLNKHMKRIFGDLDDKMVRKELKDLTQLWKPFDENAVPASYKSYRYSAVELYADAISVLFNDPVLLQQKAPIFYDKFFKYLDKKPTIKENFFAIQDTLNQGEEAVFKARDEDLERAFGKGEEGFVAKELEKQKRMTSLMYQVQTLFDDKNTPIIKKVRQAQKAGKPIAPKDNPEFALHGFNYTDGKLKNYVNDNLQPAFSKAQEVNNGWVELGKILQLERSVFERGELANPGGYNPDTARKQLEMMEKSLTPEEWKKLQEAKDIFREAVKKSVDRAEKKGFYTPELISQMKMNPAYATFQVIDYLDTYISSKVYQSTGTLKDVANPATSTVMKLISVEKAIERNDVKKLNIKFLKKEFSDEIEPAKTKWNGKSMEVRDPSDPAIGLVITIEGGKPQGYYVDKDIANTLNHTSNDTIRGMARVSRALSQSKFYRPLFTSFNLGFQTFNFVRDFMRYWKNIPDQNIGEAITSFPRAIKRYTQAAPHATKRALNLKDDLIKEMENSKVIGLTYNDMFSSRDIDEHRPQIERVLEKSGITSQKERKKILIPLHWALDAIETTGNFIETLPKVAGYIELKNKMPEAEMAEFIRKNVGSPDFRIGGTATPVSNNIFLFSNAIKEGIKSDLKIGFTKNQSRSGFWWKTVASSFLPKFIMAAVASGYFGKKLKEQMDKASEYDKTNYIIIPLGLDENGKSVYLRTPQDETGRFMGGMLWKMLNLGKKDKSVQDVFDIFSFGAGQIPNLSPAFTGAGALLTYLSGKNPYDRFRGRNVIPDKEFAAGPKYSLPVLMKWLAKNQGWGIFFPTNYNYYNEEMTSLQKTLNKPFLSNILGRWIKVSDYGETEKYRKTIKAVEKERSIRLLGEREKLDAAIKEYKAGDKNLARLERIEEKLVEDILGKSPYKGTDKAKATSTKKKLRIAILRGESDERVNAIISASTNEAKIELLRQIEAEMEGNEYQELIDLLKENKIISKNLIKELNK